MSVETMLDTTGKVVIITGGGRGVGHGISDVFLDACAHVIICGRSKPDDLPAVNGNSALFCATDVKDPAAVQACVDFVVENLVGSTASSITLAAHLKPTLPPCRRALTKPSLSSTLSRRLPLHKPPTR